jgi:alpha-beta hydrolase superfamily lysophospholipase
MATPKKGFPIMLRILRWFRRTLTVAFALFGFVAAVLLAMIAVPPVRPPTLASVSGGPRTDLSGLPQLSRFQARDGTELAFRHYQPVASALPNDRVAVLVHGSSGGSRSMYPLAKAISERGVETFAMDVRGHGASGTRGDIGYLGQLEDDLADLVGQIRIARPTAEITLVGFSSGGGFALRVAGSPIKEQFARTVLLAPYLGNDAPTSRPSSGGWASPSVPRILGLVALRTIGVTCCESLPVIAFAVPPNSEKAQTSVYSFRLLANFGVLRDYRKYVASATRPLTIYAGADDELMFADKYADAVRGFSNVNVKVLDGLSHMGLIYDARAAAVIADDVARRQPVD